MNSGSGDGKGYQGMDGTAKFTNIVIAGFGRDEIWSEKVTFSSIRSQGYEQTEWC